MQEMTISIQSVEECATELKALTIGVLYELKCGHPVLDGVGLFNVEGSQTQALVFIQISVRNFNDHKKLGKIFDKPLINAPELTNSEFNNYFTCFHQDLIYSNVHH